MGDALIGILELAVSIAAGTVYGTPDRPRPRYLRHVVRGVAFGGAIAALLVLAGVLQNGIPTFAIFVWALCGMIVFLGEYDLGNGWIALAAWGLAGALLVTALVVA